MTNRIQGTTMLLGLLGNPIKHSRSPHMHNSAFEKLGLDYVYMCFEVPKGEVNKGLEALKTLNAVGGNITFPHKEDIVAYLDHITEDAQLIGAINTIRIDPETKEVKGFNTDGRGFIASLDEQKVEFRGKKVVLVGIGGAGKAIAVNLAMEGAGELVLGVRKEAQGQELKEILNINYPKTKIKVVVTSEENLKDELQDSALLINATALGMKGNDDKCIISSADPLHKDLFVYDIVYDPGKTKLLQYAEEKGCGISNGISMVLWQGAIAFKIWMGEDMPVDYIRGKLFED